MVALHSPITPVPGDFSLAFSPLSSSRLSVLAFLTTGEASAPDIGDAIGVNRVQAWRVCKELKASGFVAPSTSVENKGSAQGRRWAITPSGVRELSSVSTLLEQLITGYKHVTRKVISANAAS